MAFQEMIHWLEKDGGIPAIEGYILFGQIAEALRTQVFGAKYKYICKVGKAILSNLRRPT